MPAYINAEAVLSSERGRWQSQWSYGLAMSEAISTSSNWMLFAPCYNMSAWLSWPKPFVPSLTTRILTEVRHTIAWFYSNIQMSNMDCELQSGQMIGRMLDPTSQCCFTHFQAINVASTEWFVMRPASEVTYLILYQHNGWTMSKIDYKHVFIYLWLYTTNRNLRWRYIRYMCVYAHCRWIEIWNGIGIYCLQRLQFRTPKI